MVSDRIEKIIATVQGLVTGDGTAWGRMNAVAGAEPDPAELPWVREMAASMQGMTPDQIRAAILKRVEEADAMDDVDEDE